MFHLQPDIVAPGVDILASYSKLITITGSPNENRVNVYDIISGTSMACPHVTGPAAIKSALMTTGYSLEILPLSLILYKRLVSFCKNHHLMVSIRDCYCLFQILNGIHIA